MAVTCTGQVLVPGDASGTLLLSQDPLSFWGGYDAVSGEIIDRRHPLSGSTGTDRIMAIPGTRGSSTTTAVLIESFRRNTAPAGFLVTDRDTFLSLAAVVAELRSSLNKGSKVWKQGVGWGGSERSLPH